MTPEPLVARDSVPYYERFAEAFAARAGGLDLSALYEPFLARVPRGGRILDAGCGPGRDSAAFLARGYEVEAFDASPKLVAEARQRTGLEVQRRRFEEYEAAAELDGVWACASLLHIPSGRLPSVLERLARALRPGRPFFMSFKHGEGERREGLRFFTDLTPLDLERILDEVPNLEATRVWTSESIQRGAEQLWTLALAERV